MVTHIGTGSGLGPSAGRVNSYWESITKTGMVGVEILRF